VNDHISEPATAEHIEAAFDGRWGAWLSDTGRWWAARIRPLTAEQITAGCAQYVRADTPGELMQAIRDEEQLTDPEQDIR
jgi:hypothetical protein